MVNLYHFVTYININDLNTLVKRQRLSYQILKKQYSTKWYQESPLKYKDTDSVTLREINKATMQNYQRESWNIYVNIRMIVTGFIRQVSPSLLPHSALLM